MAAVAIRPFEPRDRDGVAALYRAAWHAAYDSIDGPDTIDRIIATQLAGPAPDMFALPADDVALVAEREGIIIGGARAHPRADGIHISGFYVLPALQRKGLGTALLTTLMSLWPAATDWRADVRPASHAARAFYKRHGFREIGSNRGNVGAGHVVDVIEMRRA